MKAAPTDGPDAAGIRRALRSGIVAMGGPVQILAESLLGEEDARIDWLAVEPGGRLWIVLADVTGDDERLLVSGLAQRSWVRARVSDWRQFARDLPLRGDDPPLLVLLAPEFSRLVRVAAAEAGSDEIRLGRYRWQAELRGGVRLLVERVAPLDSRTSSEGGRAAPAPRASVFKSALTDRDFERQDGSLAPEGGDNYRPPDDNS